MMNELKDLLDSGKRGYLVGTDLLVLFTTLTLVDK